MRNVVGTGAATGSIDGVESLVQTYTNISRYQSQLLNDFKKSLSIAANQQPIREQSFTNPNATDAEKKMALWQGFGGGQQQQSGTQPETQPETQPGSQAVQRNQAYRYFDQKTRQFMDVDVQSVVRDAKGQHQRVCCGRTADEAPEPYACDGRQYTFAPTVPKLFETYTKRHPNYCEWEAVCVSPNDNCIRTNRILKSWMKMGICGSFQ